MESRGELRGRWTWTRNSIPDRDEVSSKLFNRVRTAKVLLERLLRGGLVDVELMVDEAGGGHHLHLVAAAVDDGAQAQREHRQRRRRRTARRYFDLVDVVRHRLITNESMSVNCFSQDD